MMFHTDVLLFVLRMPDFADERPLMKHEFVSGPKRYDYVPESDDWRYARDGIGLGELLDEEITDMLRTKVSLHLEGVSRQIQ